MRKKYTVGTLRVKGKEKQHREIRRGILHIEQRGPAKEKFFVGFFSAKALTILVGAFSASGVLVAGR